MNRYYPASLDQLCKILSIALPFALIFPIITLFEIGMKEGRIEAMLIVGVVVAAFTIAWFLHPKGYDLGEHGITIKLAGGKRFIPYADIQDARRVAKEDLGFGFRTWASGGLFGYFGHFYYKKIGGHTIAWATNRANMVLITTHSRRYLLSPDEADGFVAALQSGLNRR